MDLQAMKQAVVAALEDIKAKDIMVLDVAALTSMTECMIIASADSNRQTRALSANVQDKLREAGEPPLGVEGEENGEWVLIDFGPVVVHIMQPAVREYYSLEELWGGRRPSGVKSRETALAA
jgi:ribosome-associated protein